ncbi:MAG: hypothetical protein O3A14_05460 [Cyanobacteria bacterium]|nr:hypothetical protein [Cyanobacteriota bacterium]
MTADITVSWRWASSGSLLRRSPTPLAYGPEILGCLLKRCI